MLNFILNGILWTLALYGLFEIIKNIIYICTYTNLKSDGIYIIIATKNQENKIEGFLRTILFRIMYGKEECVKDVIVTDLDSTDDTMKILSKLSKDYDEIKVVNWKECKEVIDNIKEAEWKNSCIYLVVNISSKHCKVLLNIVKTFILWYNSYRKIGLG